MCCARVLILKTFGRPGRWILRDSIILCIWHDFLLMFSVERSVVLSMITFGSVCNLGIVEKQEWFDKNGLACWAKWLACNLTHYIDCICHCYKRRYVSCVRMRACISWIGKHFEKWCGIQNMRTMFVLSGTAKYSIGFSWRKWVI